MKFNDTTNKTVVSDNLVKKDISVNENSMKKIVSIISQYMYTDASSAFREYWLNARESVDFYTKSIGENGSDQGQSYCQPTEIQLPYLPSSYSYNYGYNEKESILGYDFIINPNQEERRFYIRDYATGLTEEELETIIASAGETTKNDSNEYGGGFGIGTLSGFKVSDTVIFTAYKDGKQSQMLLSSHDNKLVKMPTIDTNEPNGVRVEFDILDDNKLEEFSHGALKFLEKAPKDERALIIYHSSHGLKNHEELATERFGNSLTKIDRAGEKNHIDLSVNGCYYKGIYNENVFNKVAKKIFSTYIEKIPKSRNNYVYNKDIAKSFAQFLLDNFAWNVPVGYLQGVSPTRESFSLNEEELTDYFSKVLEETKEDLELVKDYCDSVYNYIAKNQEKELEEKFYNEDYNYLRPLKENFSDVFEIFLKKKDIERKTAGEKRFDHPVLRFFILNLPRLDGYKYNLIDKNIEVYAPRNYTMLVIPGQQAYITANINGKDYDLFVSTKKTYRQDNELAIDLAEINDQKHLVSSNRNSNIFDWKAMINDIRNEDYEDVLDKKLSKEVSKIGNTKIGNNGIILSNSGIREIVNLLNLLDIDAKVYGDGDAIDGALIRRAHTKLFKKKNKLTNKVEYSILSYIDDDINAISIPISDYAEELKQCEQVFVYDVDRDDFSSDTLYKKYNHYQVFSLLCDVLYKGKNVALIRTSKTNQKFSKLYERLEENGISYKSIKEIPNNKEIFKKCLETDDYVKYMAKFLTICNYLVTHYFIDVFHHNEIDIMNRIIKVYKTLESDGLYSSDVFADIEKELSSYDVNKNCINYEISDFLRSMCKDNSIRQYVIEEYNVQSYLDEIILMRKIERSSYFKFVKDFDFSLEDKKKVFDIMIGKIKES